MAGRRLPQQRVGDDWYLGTANAVYQNLYSVEKSGAGFVLVLAADHVYKMDYRRMLEYHRGHGGPVTVATLRVPVAEAAGQFGVVEVDADARVVRFREKPDRPAPVPGDEGHCLASMGIYAFTTAFLVDELRASAEGPDPGHDFGHHILPRAIGRAAVRAFTFSGRGTGAAGYWRDVGTVDAYYRANMDLLAGPPGLDLYDRAWPVYSFQPSFPPPRVAVVPEPAGCPAGGPRRNIFANGTVSEGWVRGSVVGFDCRVEAGAVVEDSVVCDGTVVGEGAEVRQAILDKGVVWPGARVGVDPGRNGRGGSRSARTVSRACRRARSWRPSPIAGGRTPVISSGARDAAREGPGARGDPALPRYQADRGAGAAEEARTGPLSTERNGAVD